MAPASDALARARTTAAVAGSRAPPRLRRGHRAIASRRAHGARRTGEPPVLLRRGWLYHGAGHRGGVGSALLVRVLLFSTVVTLLLTILQLTLSYRSERARLDERFVEIDQATSRSLGESLWTLDSRQIEEQLDGILRLPSIRA